MENLYHLLIAAQNGETQAVAKIVKTFEPLLMSRATQYHYFDEDCYQECIVALIDAIHKIKFKEKK